ncbi:hypothetical protein GNP35_06285 [Psychrosphaera haliotis]|uniref:SPOR domain-containing protein n=2 Tax=Psychrosphaera haliotis TaxID=555083 RepID=A0A6N8F6C3_9GAMM|nr:hypothetical protein [Psychrosphaera haliotis]
MTDMIKQRLLGMLIVVIAGVVFLPDLLDGKKEATKADFKKIPAKPAFEQEPSESKFPVDLVEEAIANIPSDSDEIAVDETISDNSASTTIANENANETEADDNNVAATNIIAPDSNASTEVKTQSEDVKAEITTKIQDDFQKPMWILQLGSFKHKENVVTLRETLRKAGIETYTKPVKTQAGVLSKVYVGPEQDKDILVKTQLKIKEINGLVGKITRFDTRN